jgi:hypothetical protein
MASESRSGLAVRSNLDVIRDADPGRSTSCIIGRRAPRLKPLREPKSRLELVAPAYCRLIERFRIGQLKPLGSADRKASGSGAAIDGTTGKANYCGPILRTGRVQAQMELESTGSGIGTCMARPTAYWDSARTSLLASLRKRAVPRRFGPNPKPDFSGDFHPASREIKQERRST